MRIGIIGSRGIPNQFGGFEQFAEKFSTQMAAWGHDMTVYTSQLHPYKKKEYREVNLIHCYSMEHRLGTFGQFIYDFNCILNSRKQGFDIILQLGYTSSTIWSWLFPGNSILVTNMDGLEWARTKYNRLSRYFLRRAERWGAIYSDHLIADSDGIRKYLAGKYGKESAMVPYGADIYQGGAGHEDLLIRYHVSVFDYDLLIARFEPENNIEEILLAYEKLTNRKLLLIGNYESTGFGRRMHDKFGDYSHIHFAGANYNIDELNILRYNSRLYLHGHSVGGTNPSLLEAMAADAIICAHDNQFNREVLLDNAFYFKNGKDLSIIVNSTIINKNRNWIENNRQRIKNYYNWINISKSIESCFKEWLSAKQYQKVQFNGL